ncbi:hypothetical protein BGW37DRAFT_225722 [Umbelopsis sp. PMI_123]|nr:hypothetical protein BGW37DRAFT_225722 [Umbelopsis sp. PMI_123]
MVFIIFFAAFYTLFLYHSSLFFTLPFASIFFLLFFVRFIFFISVFLLFFLLGLYFFRHLLLSLV